MASSVNVERLTPLDMLMPRNYISVMLTFATTESKDKLISRLQVGLDILGDQIPWLRGKMTPQPSATDEKPSLEIRWSTNDEPLKIIDKGTIPESYETLRGQHMPPASFPQHVWPAPNVTAEEFSKQGAPVFAACVFDYEDHQGFGLCICIQHNAVDLSGLTEIARMWTRNIAGMPSSSISQTHRGRLKTWLETDLRAVDSMSTEQIYANHKEHSQTPSPRLSDSPECTSKMFTVPISRMIEFQKSLQLLKGIKFSTNTVVSALIWSAITRTRLRRSSTARPAISRLAMAVNGRARISPEFSPSDDPYFGNIVLCSLAEVPVDDCNKASESDRLNCLANVCSHIAESQSTSKMNTRHVAEIYSLVEREYAARRIHHGFDLSNDRDLLITSWAQAGFYDLDFGKGLGMPEFTRPQHIPADGLVLLLPRKGVGSPNEVLEVVLMLREDDMGMIEEAGLWGT